MRLVSEVKDGEKRQKEESKEISRKIRYEGKKAEDKSLSMDWRSNPGGHHLFFPIGTLTLYWHGR